MKKLFSLGFIFFFTLILSPTAYNAFADSKIVLSIDNIKRLMEQEPVLANLNKMTETYKVGIYQYYKDRLSGTDMVRTYSMDDRTHIEIRNKDGMWELCQIRNKKTGVIANYKDRRFVEYTRELADGTIGHYAMSKVNTIVAEDLTVKKADFYTRFTDDGLIYICFDKAKCRDTEITFKK